MCCKRHKIFKFKTKFNLNVLFTTVVQMSEVLTVRHKSPKIDLDSPEWKAWKQHLDLLPDMQPMVDIQSQNSFVQHAVQTLGSKTICFFEQSKHNFLQKYCNCKAGMQIANQFFEVKYCITNLANNKFYSHAYHAMQASELNLIELISTMQISEKFLIYVIDQFHGSELNSISWKIKFYPCSSILDALVWYSLWYEYFREKRGEFASWLLEKCDLDGTGYNLAQQILNTKRLNYTSNNSTWLIKKIDSKLVQCQMYQKCFLIASHQDLPCVLHILDLTTIVVDYAILKWPQVETSRICEAM